MIALHKLFELAKLKDTNDTFQKYVESVIIPMYKKHDKAHDTIHAIEVIEMSYKLAPLVKHDIDYNILLAAAVFHDVGLKDNRKTHHLNSGKFVRELKILNKWFTKDQIETIAQACEDHRASGKTKPRSIYGKIIGDADRTSLFSPERLFERTWAFRKDSMKNNTDDEIFEEIFHHLDKKFSSKHGYAKFNLKETEKLLSRDISRTRQIVDNKALAWKFFKSMRKSGRLKR